MKREFLIELFKKHLPETEIPKEAIDAIMDENGRDAEGGKATLAKAQSELKAAQEQVAALAEQIKQRDTDIATLQKEAATSEETKKALTELQAKYDTESKEYQTKLEEQQKEAEKQLAEQAYSHATEDFFKEQPFASELARKAAIADFKAAGLKLDPQSGKFLGADDWLKQLRETDPAAFKAEEGEDEGAEEDAPYFVAPANTGKSKPGTGTPAKDGSFNFTNQFSRLRQPPQSNPNNNNT